VLELGGTFAQSTISMGTAAVDYLAASTTYASNQGADFGVVGRPIALAPGDHLADHVVVGVACPGDA